MKKYRVLSELKGKMREKGINYCQMAEKIGLSTSAVSDKINGNSVFDLAEASKMIEILEIPKEEINRYFF